MQGNLTRGEEAADAGRDRWFRAPVLSAVVLILAAAVLALWTVASLVSYVVQSKGDLLLVTLVLGVGLATVLALCLTVMRRNSHLRRQLAAASRRRGEVEEISLAAAGLAHETKNPLGIIRGLAQQIADDNTNPERAREKARLIMEEADITTTRLGDFISYAKVRQPHMGPVDAAVCMGSVCSLVAEDLAASSVRFERNISSLRVRADAEMLSQILLNLLNNSLRATEAGDSVTVALTPCARRRARLVVSDTGSGIPADYLPRLFQPYASRHPGGHGIGMAIVKKMVDRCGWDIHVSSTDGKGTRVAVTGIEVYDSDSGDGNSEGAGTSVVSPSTPG